MYSLDRRWARNCALLFLVLFTSVKLAQANGSPPVPTVIDVTNQMTITQSGLTLNRSSNTFDTNVTITNSSQQPIQKRLSLILTAISPPTITFANVSGVTSNGLPFVNVVAPGESFLPGTKITGIVLKFRNPESVPFSFKLAITATVEDSRPPIVDAPGAALSLALRIFSGNAQDAREAVSEAYSLAGIATHSLDSGLVRAATPPTIPVKRYTFEIDSLTFDVQQRARGGWRLTLGELGTTLEQLGWQAPAGRDVGTILRDVLARAIQKAKQDPTNPHSFTPLFLQAIAAASQPAIDLGTGTAHPNAIKFSLMEAELLLFAHFRDDQSYGPLNAATERPKQLNVARQKMHPMGAPRVLPTRLQTPSGWFRNTTRPSQSWGSPRPRLVEISTGCETWRKEHPHYAAILDLKSDMPIKAIYKALGLGEDVFGEIAKFGLSNALNVLFVLITLNEQYLSLTNEPAEQHYNYTGIPEATAHEIRFTAFAGIIILTPADLKEGRRILNECFLKPFGFATIPDPDKDLKDARVVWHVETLSPHATWGLSKNHLDFHIRPSTILGSDGMATFVADMVKEPEEAHRIGRERRDKIIFVAELDTSEAPDRQTILKIILAGPEALGEVPDAILEILLEAFKKWNAPKQQVELPVTWHERWKGTSKVTATQTDSDITLTHTATANVTWGGGPGSDLIPVEGTMTWSIVGSGKGCTITGERTAPVGLMEDYLLIDDSTGPPHHYQGLGNTGFFDVTIACPEGSSTQSLPGLIPWFWTALGEFTIKEKVNPDGSILRIMKDTNPTDAIFGIPGRWEWEFTTGP